MHESKGVWIMNFERFLRGEQHQYITVSYTHLPLEMAVQLVNSAVASEGREENMPTLDLCSVDLCEGSCRFMKTGAAVSFIKRGSIVEKIDGGTFPLGAFGYAQAKPAECQLMDGDYIIMLLSLIHISEPAGFYHPAGLKVC